MSTPEILAKLSEYDFILVVDKSGSMGETDMANNRSRYDHMQETAVAFARDIGQIDSDGIGLVLFSGSSIVVKDGVNADAVKDAFAANRPSGSTPLAEALTEALKLAGKSAKKDFICVFTDGAPDNGGAAAEVIRQQSNKQDTDEDCTILFVQVGRDPAATRYLQSLDDDLKGAKFDIVDAKTLSEFEQFPSTADAIVAAING